MCIVIIKPSDKKMPKRKVLKNCWDNNPDGAGFMFLNKDKKVIISKGYMVFEDLISGIESYKLDKTACIVFHFRIATAGSIKPANCHPFPNSNKVEDLQALSAVSDYGIAHNGILDYPDDEMNDMSDTMTFIRDILHSEVILNNLKSPAITSLLQTHIKRSKFAIMGSAGVVMLGAFLKVGDLYYSNTGYKKETGYSWWIKQYNWDNEAIDKNYYEDMTEGNITQYYYCQRCDVLITDESLYYKHCYNCGEPIVDMADN